MAVRIRLMRMGSKKRPFYRFVVVDSRGKRDGGFLDTVGHYNPIAQPEEIRVDEEKVFDWLGKGAEISSGARSLLKKTGVLNRWNAKRSGVVLAEAPGSQEEETPEAVAPDSADVETQVLPRPAARGPKDEVTPEPAEEVTEVPQEEPAAAPEAAAENEAKEVTEETEDKDTP